MAGLIRKKAAPPQQDQQDAPMPGDAALAENQDTPSAADQSAQDPNVAPDQGASPGAYPETGESPSQDTKTGAGEPSNVSPEEQAAYDQFVNNAYNVIYSGQDQSGKPTPAPAILQSLKASQDPIDNLAHTTVLVVNMVQQSAQKAGKQVPDDVVFHASTEIGEDLANLAKLAKIHDYSEKELQAAFYRGADMYRQMGEASGQINPDDLKQQMGVVAEADKRGMLPKLLPGIDKQADKGGQQDQGGDNGGAA